MINALTAVAIDERSDAKIRSQMPLRMRRLVISLTSYIKSVVPAVSVTMISTSRPELALRTCSRLNRNA